MTGCRNDIRWPWPSMGRQAPLASTRVFLLSKAAFLGIRSANEFQVHKRLWWPKNQQEAGGGIPNHVIAKKRRRRKKVWWVISGNQVSSISGDIIVALQCFLSETFSSISIGNLTRLYDFYPQTIRDEKFMCSWKYRTELKNGEKGLRKK